MLLTLRALFQEFSYTKSTKCVYALIQNRKKTFITSSFIFRKHLFSIIDAMLITQNRIGLGYHHKKKFDILLQSIKCTSCFTLLKHETSCYFILKLVLIVLSTIFIILSKKCRYCFLA